MPCLDCVSRWIARNQVVSGSRVLAKSVPAVRETWCLQVLHWKSLRVRSRQWLREPQARQRKPRGQRALRMAAAHCGSLP